MDNALDTILVTGGAGFIGSNLVHNLIRNTTAKILNLDKLTYAGNLENLSGLQDESRHTFVAGDIGDQKLIQSLLKEHKPNAIINLAAESHVDKSIHGPGEFVQTNIVGTFRLLEEARAFWSELQAEEADSFRFLHVSTDEVYGSLSATDPAFSETSPYAPNSPYAASKASSDHLVRSYHHTYGLPTLTTNCSNNYGPYQFPEKLIPLIIRNCLNEESLPIYGDGQNVRDWLYVEDHCDAIHAVLKSGRVGEVYNIGGNHEKTNLDVVHAVCNILDGKSPRSSGAYHDLITFVSDRIGHDRRYAINADKITNEMGWSPVETFETGIEKTVSWYLENPKWVESVASGEYRDWIKQNYGNR